ncbi:ABC transporter ATP-binding protein [Pectinatus haikarae]|uniref:Iron complex transport system ATP-binding protein n=1 Tax=Pectinatus haikarae TaxID=349096 RepID=A0ABT9Y814_9FIRM|nr:ABC transporter ATP-binding protein [Pectinatus haikarae]MDQ0203846.1 iron complex transport system ATP-binding protein [Pectinatus haikarae]
MSALRTENICVSFQNKMVLENISLNFPEGKITAVLGPNGCGKSTLLRIMAGFHRNYEGKVFLDGKALRELSAENIARRMAVLPQTVSIPADLSVYQLVAYGRFPYRGIFKKNEKDDQKIIDWAMQETGIQSMADRQLNALSGGERQRAWIAMALCQQPEILLLDEPTTYLDIAHQLEIMQLIRLLNKHRNMTVVMVLHDINHARSYADNAVLIKDHKIFSEGQPDKVLSVPALAKVFNVKAQMYQNKINVSDEIIFATGLSK